VRRQLAAHRDGSRSLDPAVMPETGGKAGAPARTEEDVT
jgi:hypothetical protein